MSRSLRARCALPATLALLAASTGHAEVSLEVKAWTGVQAPGSAPGRILQYLGDPVVNDLGAVAFEAAVSDPLLDLWGKELFGPDAAGQLTRVASSFDPVPDLPPDARFDFDQTFPRIDDACTVVFGAELSGLGIDYPETASGIWRWQAGSGLERIVRAGDPVPGAGPDATLGPLGGIAPVLGSGGVVGFSASVVDPEDSIGRQAFFRVAAGQLTSFVIEGAEVPGIPGSTLGWAVTPVANAHGVWSFSTGFAGPGVVPGQNDAASFSWDPQSGLSIRVRAGDPAPGTQPGVVIGSWPDAWVHPNDAGDVAQLALLTGPGVSDANDTALYGPSAGGLALVAREGDPAPGTEPDTVFGAGPHSVVINAGGQVVFYAGLLGPSVTLENGFGIWRHDPVTGVVELLVRQGDPAPELPGVMLAWLGHPILNDRGDVVFSAGLVGPGVTPETDRAIFALEGGVIPRKVFRRGDLLSFGPGDLRPVTMFWLPSHTLVGVPGARLLSNEGHLAFVGDTAEGPAAVVVVATIPEPGFTSGLVAGLVLLAGLARSRSRR